MDPYLSLHHMNPLADVRISKQEPALPSLTVTINHVERGLSKPEPDYKELAQFVKSEVETMSHSPKSGAICKDFIAHNRETIKKTLALAIEGNTEKAFPIVLDFVQGAYSAYINSNPELDKSTFNKLTACVEDSNSIEEAASKFTAILDNIITEITGAELP